MTEAADRSEISVTTNIPYCLIAQTTTSQITTSNQPTNQPTNEPTG
jgi:hypothetical protein